MSLSALGSHLVMGVRVFERFTDRGRRVVVLAQENARMCNHNYIGTEHILLGLLHEGEGVACRALEGLGISLEAVREQVQEIIGQGQQAISGHIPLTLRAKTVLELSLREALQLGHNYIGTEHILLGLLREGEGVAAQVLTRLGVELPKARAQVIQLLTGYRKEEDTRVTPPGKQNIRCTGALTDGHKRFVWKDRLNRYWRAVAGEWFIWGGDQGGWLRPGMMDQVDGGWWRVGEADQWKPGDPEE
jgi:ATP-dependent Clp protease ATP-binding subunit ClpA